MTRISVPHDLAVLCHMTLLCCVMQCQYLEYMVRCECKQPYHAVLYNHIITLYHTMTLPHCIIQSHYHTVSYNDTTKSSLPCLLFRTITLPAMLVVPYNDTPCHACCAVQSHSPPCLLCRTITLPAMLVVTCCVL